MERSINTFFGGFAAGLALVVMFSLSSCEYVYSPCGYQDQQITYYDSVGNITGYGCVETNYYLNNPDLFGVDENGNLTQIRN